MFLLRLSTGYCESGSNASVSITYERNEDISPFDLVNKFVSDLHGCFKGGKKCCSKPSLSSRFCSNCGQKNIKPKREDLALEWFNEYFSGTVDDVGSCGSEVIEGLNKKGWNLWDTATSQFIEIDCCYIDEIIAGERKLEPWMVQSWSILRTKIKDA